MALSGAEYSMAVMTAFPLSLVVILFSVPFPINIKVFNGSNDSFLFVFGRYTIQCPFPYQYKYFRLFPKLFLYRSCSFFQGDLGYAEDIIILGYVSRLFGLLLHDLGYTLPRFGPWAPM